MPIYEYTCKDCGTNFDRLVRSSSETDNAECPKCNSHKTARALSVFAVKAEGGSPSASSAPAGGGCCPCGGPGPCGG